MRNHLWNREVVAAALVSLVRRRGAGGAGAAGRRRRAGVRGRVDQAEQLRRRPRDDADPAGPHDDDERHAQDADPPGLPAPGFSNHRRAGLARVGPLRHQREDARRASSRSRGRRRPAPVPEPAPADDSRAAGGALQAGRPQRDQGLADLRADPRAQRRQARTAAEEVRRPTAPRCSPPAVGAGAARCRRPVRRSRASRCRAACGSVPATW